MGKKVIHVSLGVLTVFLFSGCAAYWANRGKDFADIAKVGVGFGGGLGVDAQATDFVHPSIGVAAVGFCVGHESRDVSGVWMDASVFFPVATIMGNLLGKELPEAGGGTSAHLCVHGERRMVIEVSRYMVWKDRYTLKEEENKPNGKPVKVSWVKRMGVEATVGVPFVMARAGANPAELLDFLLGFTTLDIAGDDDSGQEAETSPDS